MNGSWGSACSWYRRRNYPHFDSEVRFSAAQRIVSDPAAVARHSFFPFIRRIKSTPRYRAEQNGDGGKVRRVRHKRRPICYAAHVDSHIYSYYSKCILGPAYEKYLVAANLNLAVTAYRRVLDDNGRGRCNIHFAKELFDFIREQDDCAVLTFDIENFFESLDHDLLKDEWQRLMAEGKLRADHFAIYRSLTRYSYVAERRLRKHPDLATFFALTREEKKGKRICSGGEFRRLIREGGFIIRRGGKGEGIPQGSPLSALLSNIYMIPFDKVIEPEVVKLGGLYRRYSDDLVIVCGPEAAARIKQLIRETIMDRKLTIQPAKTEEYHCARQTDGSYLIHDRVRKREAAIQYLGFEFNGRTVLIRQGSVTRYYRKAARAILRTVKQAAVTPAAHPCPRQVRRTKLIARFSHLGYKQLQRKPRRSKAKRWVRKSRNFITYARDAARIMNEPAISRQVARHTEWINRTIRRLEAEYGLL